MRRIAWFLLIVPFIALLIPQFYASASPRLWGVPYFVWYQFLWVILGSIITAIVYLIARPSEA